tara:strand:+ start:5555 stop:6295 length:741 start_codon:yes stop_codon:yes gene_type:complete
MSITAPLTPIAEIRSLNLYIYTAVGADSIIYTFRTGNENLGYFIESYNIFKTDFLTRLQRQGELENKVFLISYRLHKNNDGTILKAFGGVGDKIKIDKINESALEFDGSIVNTTYGLTYSNIEKQKLDESYRDDAVVSLQFDITQREAARTPPQNMVQTSRISYDSISSLGPISSESFTISSTSATDTEDIEFGTEVITDVGGVVSRDRELANTEVSGEIYDAVLTEEGDDETAELRITSVTTSGY